MATRQFSETGVNAVLVINCGSSSVKFALFAADPTIPRLVSGALDRIGLADGQFHAKDSTGNVLVDEQPPLANHKVALALLINVIKQKFGDRPLLAVGHRVVHGGADCDCPLPVTRELEARLRRLIPLAPLHLPHNLAGISRRAGAAAGPAASCLLRYRLPPELTPARPADDLAARVSG